jgi:Uma2 family endonuclease
MNAVLEIPKLPNSVVLDPPLSDEEFEELSAANELVKLERDKEGKIIVSPPAGADSGDANSEIIYQLRAWWKKHKEGRVYDSNTGFFLPDGSSLSPDAAYVTAEQMRSITKEDRKHFLRLTPAFVIELLSASDSHSRARKKMESWIANGAQVGWLIDPYNRNVLIYEPGRAVRLDKADKVAGTGPVEGFVLDLAPVWSAYED